MTVRASFASLAPSRRVLDLAMLYASKSGAVLVGIFILPLFQKLLGPEAFGVVAVILSLQAFLIAMDLGMSAIVGRDIAAADNLNASLSSWCHAETVLHCAYAVFLLLALFVGAVLPPTSLTPLQLVVSLIMFWALSVQNVGQSALLARRCYRQAGVIQTAGVLGRGLFTLLALHFIRPDLDVFVITQTICAVIQLIVTRVYCLREFEYKRLPAIRRWPLGAEVRALALRGKPLMLFGLAGASVLQLDKIVVSSFVSPIALAPYYLASALCLTPISVLGAPIAQFFQPKLIRSIASQDSAATNAVLRRFVSALVCVVAIPSAILWLGREDIVSAWVGGQRNADQIAHYLAILLPGVAIGALGHVPYVMLLAKQDFRFQARASTVLTVFTLTATYAAASYGSVEAVCWIYAGYHSLSTIVSWYRCIQLEPLQPHHYATNSAIRAFVVLSLIALSAALLAGARATANLYLHGN